MAADNRCDIAIWDASGVLLAGVRSQLKNRVKLDGPKLSIETGEWLDRRVALGQPQPLIAKHVAPFSEVLSALVAVHRPRQLLVVGPAATAGEGLAVGDAVLESEVQLSGPRLTPGRLATGSIPRAGSDASVTTDWASACRGAAEDLGLAVAMIAVVTSAPLDDPVEPPSSKPRTLSRKAGVLVGQLLRGKPVGQAEQRDAINAATDAVAAVVRAC